MRPQQQNRRMRGRNGGGGNNNNNNNNNQNRKGPNPLTRNYESNGPDVKIRGSAQQIAEKYAQLARDAQSSGDRVMAENYLQHAEHYNRIIAAAQAQMPIQHVQNQRDMSDEDGDDEFEGNGQPTGNAETGNAEQQNAGQGGPDANNATGNNANGNSDNGGERRNGNNGSGEYRRREQAEFVAQGSGEQPVIEGMPAEVALNPEAASEGNGAPRGEARDGRRSRRPRRGERSRPDENDDASEGAEGLAATLSRGGARQPAPEAAAPEAPAAEIQPATQAGGDAALVDADN